MKRFLVMLTLLCAMSTTTVFAKEVEFKVFIDNNEVVMDSQPGSYRGSTFVPISFIARELGATVSWSSPNVTIVKGDTTLVLTVDSNAYTKNGVTYYSQFKPFVANGRTYVPLRFVSNAFEYPVGFEKTSNYETSNSTDYTITNKITIDTTKKATVENKFVEDNSTFTASSNGKYGFKTEFCYGSIAEGQFDNSNYLGRMTVTYFKNFETGEFKEIYFTSSHADTYWANNKLILSGHEDSAGGKARPHFLMYDPTTDELTDIVDAYYGFYYEPTNSFMYSTTVYASDGTSDNGSTFFSKDMTTGVVTKITQDEYYKYFDLEQEYKRANY